MKLQIVRGYQPFEELCYNQEFETIEARMAELRLFMRKTPLQRKHLLRCRQVDPLTALEWVMAEAWQLHAAISRSR